MPPPPDFGFIPEEDFGFVPEEDGEAPAAELEALPRGMRETGARVERLPETTFQVDPRRPARSRTIIADDPSVELREYEPAKNALVGRRVTEGDDGPPSVGGVELPSHRSAARAYAAAERGAGAGDVLSALLPTAPGGRQRGADERPFAGVVGAAQGTALGAADEYVGARDTLLGALMRAGVDVSGPALVAGMAPAEVAAASLGAGGDGQYERSRDAFRAVDRDARELAPGAYTAGQVGGSLPLMAAAPAGQATALGRIGASSAVGGLAGAAQGVGESEATDLAGLLRAGLSGGATGAATGAVAQGALEGAGGALSRLGRWALGAGRATAQGAAEARLEASGLIPNPAPSTRYGRALARLGGPERVAQMLDAERVGGRFPTAADVPEAVARMDREAGRQFDGVLGAMDEAGAGVPVQRYVEGIERGAREIEGVRTGPAQRAASRMRDEYIAPWVDQAAPAPQPLAERSMGWQQAHGLRQQLDQESRAWSRSADPTDTSSAGLAQRARDELGGLMDEAAEGVDPAVRGTWREANRRYALSRLLDENARPSGSRLPGAIAEGASIAQGDPVGATAARASGWLWSRYGAGFRARGMQGLSAALRQIGGRGPQFAQVLDAAAQRGPQAVAVAHWMLSQRDPEYRALTRELQGDGEE